MKISNIKITKFHQFEGFELDLTYPKGREKQDKPLDKVCFIGQSGTGKTTLLEMIATACMRSSASNAVGGNWSFVNNNYASFDFTNDAMTIPVIVAKDATQYSHENVDNPIYLNLLLFPSGINSHYVDNNAPKRFVDSPEEAKIEDSASTELYRIFNKKELDKTWKNYYEKIKNYKRDSINARLRFFEDKNSSSQFDEWKNKNPNPTETIAKECLDSFLKKFNLAVKTEIDDVGELDILPIKSTVDNTVIPYENLSTGTKQIIFTAFPIYQLLRKDSIVLMDEPETSLYPDIQKEIIPYYTSFDKEKKSQFFFATHSPIIASAFEPWEIVELKFDEKGKVYREKYYEGENHVDNYRLDAQILRYDQILTRVFDLPRDSDAKRTEKLQELARLKRQVEQMKKEEMENPAPETKTIIDQYLRLSDDLSGAWAISRHEKD